MEGIQIKREVMCTLDNGAIEVGQPKPIAAQEMTSKPQVLNMELWGFMLSLLFFSFYLPFLVSYSSSLQ